MKYHRNSHLRSISFFCFFILFYHFILFAFVPDLYELSFFIQISLASFALFIKLRLFSFI
jgi:hypothetical protein